MDSTRLPRTAVVLLYDDDGVWLSRRRRSSPRSEFYGAFGSVGVHLEDGEDPETGALRGIAEEAGVILAPDDLENVCVGFFRDYAGDPYLSHEFMAKTTLAPINLKKISMSPWGKFDWLDLLEHAGMAPAIRDMVRLALK